MTKQYLKLKDAISYVKKEVKILQSLDNKGVIKFYEYSSNGIITFGTTILVQQVYIVLEYCHGSLLFDLVKKNNAMGEEVGRFFLRQMIETLEYLNNKGIVHRDLKLENLLLDQDMNIKFADFGFATNKSIDSLTEFRGTQSYMAPEIRKGELYDGRHTDIFSMGVILFTLVIGYFPFQQAEKKDSFYKQLIDGNRSENGINTRYWNNIRASHTSHEFKDLIQKIFTENGSDRITLDQIKEHPWYKGKSCDLH